VTNDLDLGDLVTPELEVADTAAVVFESVVASNLGDDGVGHD
jgi:hypothetical protein